MSYEDTYYHIYMEVREQGLTKAFDKQLEKMRTQEKHRYKDTKDMWEYAFAKVQKLKK
jgi:hypothetical protein